VSGFIIGPIGSLRWGHDANGVDGGSSGLKMWGLFGGGNSVAEELFCESRPEDSTCGFNA
jgi:hypothetical protein